MFTLPFFALSRLWRILLARMQDRDNFNHVRVDAIHHLAWDTLPAALRHAVRGARAEHGYLARYEEVRRRNPWRPRWR